MAEIINLDLELWPKQLKAFNSEATEILFGGASEGGKSHLARVLLIAACLAVPGIQCALIRKKKADILTNHLEGATGFRALLAPLVEKKAVDITQDYIRFPQGAMIHFIHCQDERQFTSAQGNERQIVVIDEATQISQRLIGYFRAWCRISMELKSRLPAEWRDKLPLILYTANPVGPSVPYFRREFVKARPEGVIEQVHGFKRQYILSRAEDNMSVDLEAHKARLEGLNDPALAKALDVGDWDAPVGEFFPEYDESIHVVPDFMPPEHWFKYRSFDWGSAEPFAVGWWCVSDGEEFLYNGNKFWFPHGSIILYREWVGCNPEKPADGIGMRNEAIARGIVERTPEMTSGITLTDSLPFQDRGGPSIASIFFENGVPLTKADTSRVTGWKHIRDRLVGREGFPLIYFCESCKYTRDYLPALPRDPKNREDAAEHGETTHNSDMVRYASAARPLVKTAPPPVSYVVKPAIMTFGEAIEKQQAKRRANTSRF